MDDLRVAAVCMHAEPGEVEKNLDRIRTFALEASAGKARMVCFPELSVTGYVLDHPGDIYGVPGWETALKGLVRIAREANLVLMAGLIEKSSNGKPFITQAVAGPEGLIGVHRKTHLSPAEQRVYQAGQKLDVFTWAQSTFGVQLCYEAHFPETSTVMALLGAHVLFVPHASPRGRPKEKLESWQRHLPARAFDNGVFVVACNQVGKTKSGFLFPGVALVLGPDGRELTRYLGEEEQILFAELKADMLYQVRTHKMKYFLPARRPELYRELF